MYVLFLSRNAEKSEDHFERCVRSLEEEILFNAGHLLTLEEPAPSDLDQNQNQDRPDQEDGPPTPLPLPPIPRRPRLKRKLGRGFRHALSRLYLRESGTHGTITMDTATHKIHFWLINMGVDKPVSVHFKTPLRSFPWLLCSFDTKLLYLFQTNQTWGNYLPVQLAY